MGVFDRVGLVAGGALPLPKRQAAMPTATTTRPTTSALPVLVGRSRPPGRTRGGTSGSGWLRVDKARVQLLQEPAPVKPKELRILLEEATRVRPAGERVEALLFKRDQLARPDLGRPLDIGQLQTPMDPGRAQR
jgi:hypothetical protein